MAQSVNLVMTSEQRRLFDMTKQLDDSTCWVWQGQVSNSGYGRLKQAQHDNSLKMISAQSASYQAFIGSIPDDCLVKQRCGNRLCINPEHLVLIQIR